MTNQMSKLTDARRVVLTHQHKHGKHVLTRELGGHRKQYKAIRLKSFKFPHDEHCNSSVLFQVSQFILRTVKVRGGLDSTKRMGLS